jgi:hypothetical protein
MVILKASNPAAGWKGPARRLLTHPLPFKYESTDPRPSCPMKWAMKLEGCQVSFYLMYHDDSCSPWTDIGDQCRGKGR